MLSSPTPASGSRAIAANALRRAGLMDDDTRMRDVTQKPHRKGHNQKSIPRKPRTQRTSAVDTLLGKDRSSSSHRDPMVVARIAAAAASDGISIKGASSKGAATGSRVRRNAISLSGTSTSLSSRIPITRTVELWRQFVQRRWNPEARFLNLERMIEDEFIKTSRLLPPGTRGSTPKEAAVIFKLAKELVPPVETISLAHNDLRDGIHLQTISHYLPNLSNLSLEGNRLRHWKDIESMSGRRGKLEHLRELVMTGNPLREEAFTNGRGDKYRSEMARRFPALEMLDQEPLTTISFDVPHASSSTATPVATAPNTFPFEMSPSFVTGVDGSVISTFLSRFFPSFDSQRSTLVDVYHPSGTFSYSINTAIPARIRIEGIPRDMKNQRRLEWSPWLSHGSRNLSRLGGGVESWSKTLHVGSEEAVKALLQLPKTIHDVMGSPEQFCVDAWPVPQGDGFCLFLTIHGQFTELPSEGIRSFDRSFVLVPAPEGSRARQNGWDVMILSDQLNVRHYSSHAAWAPGPMRVQAGEILPSESLASWLSSLPPQTQAQLQEAVSQIPEPQRSLVLQVCQRTRLNVRFAVDCLEGNAWDLERAVANFEQVKSTLSADAFL